MSNRKSQQKFEEFTNDCAAWKFLEEHFKTDEGKDELRTMAPKAIYDKHAILKKHDPNVVRTKGIYPMKNKLGIVSNKG